MSRRPLCGDAKKLKSHLMKLTRKPPRKHLKMKRKEKLMKKILRRSPRQRQRRARCRIHLWTRYSRPSPDSSAEYRANNCRRSYCRSWRKASKLTEASNYLPKCCRNSCTSMTAPQLLSRSSSPTVPQDMIEERGVKTSSKEANTVTEHEYKSREESYSNYRKSTRQSQKKLDSVIQRLLRIEQWL